jgi:hypothetical protein
MSHYDGRVSAENNYSNYFRIIAIMNGVKRRKLSFW